MVRLFDTKGKAIACTVIHAEPNVVLENKNNNVKIGYGSTKENKVNNPHKGIFKKAGVELKKTIKSFSNVEQTYNVGDKITVDTFNAGEYVDVQGITKGRGFTGAIFRWNFKIGPLSHGHGFPHRYQGSLAFGRGGSAPQRVYKGKKMHGHYGHETVTVQNLTVVKIIPEDNIIIVSGAIPGPEKGLVVIKTSNKNSNKSVSYDLITKEIQKQIEEENLKLEDKEIALELNEQAESVEQAIADEKAAVNEKHNAEIKHETLLEKEAATSSGEEKAAAANEESTNKPE